MKLKELKATDFQDDQKYDFFSIGATEQHGPFLPFGTDTYITDYLAEQVSKEFPELVILPTLEVSRSKEHRGFYGTLWLSEETLKSVIFDICNSIKERARNIFITSFHFNDPYIRKFYRKYKIGWSKYVHLQITDDEDDEYVETNILHGEFDGHAGNTEISNMLVIDEKLVKLPTANNQKYRVEDPFETDNLIEKCPNGIVDNHPEWLTNKDIGKRILDIYTIRMIKNLKNQLPKINSPLFKITTNTE